MAKNNIINVFAFGEEVGRIGYDEHQATTTFQYNPDFLDKNIYPNFFPKTGIIRRVKQPQLFSKFSGDTFKDLPPPIADSLPDMFGNLIFKTWLDSKTEEHRHISILEQLAYISNRGMGALEFFPSRTIPKNTSIDLDEIIEVLKLVLDKKSAIKTEQLNHKALLNIFKIGTSAGGARPKILISEHKNSGRIIPGDLEYSDKYDHYLIKLSIEDTLGYNPELIEYSYYKMATQLGITMMPSKLIDDKHFATLRYDRQSGRKYHTLTASGITGWDFRNASDSSYENLFRLASFLKLPQSQMEELFLRMVFNIVFKNNDDHLKNHAFVYDEINDRWNLSPAYDLTYAMNPLLHYTKTSRALAINGKRTNIDFSDILTIAKQYTIKNPKGVMWRVVDAADKWQALAQGMDILPKVVKNITEDIKSSELRG